MHDDGNKDKNLFFMFIFLAICLGFIACISNNSVINIIKSIESSFINKDA